MSRVEWVCEQKHLKTPLRKNQILRQEGRALSTIEELSEQEVSESEVDNSGQKNAKYLPQKDLCIVTIGADIIETVGTSRENSPIDDTGEKEQVANPDKVKVNKVNRVKKVWGEWRQHFTIDQFLFSLFLGLIPTAWDVFSDLRFGEDLAATNEISAAGKNPFQGVLKCGFMFLCLSVK